MTSVRYDHATRTYEGTDVAAVDSLDLDIGDGELLVLVGPSGSGKSTALRMLAGLEPLDGGAIYIGERDVSNVRPRDRDIAMVFQNYALYPHMTVRKNLGYGLRVRNTPRVEIDRRVDEVARLLGLESFLERRPAALSGGQRQRVAMGRAIVREPAAYLMDEPLSNLDAKLRVGMRAELSRLHERLGTTTVYVTHDQIEAMTLGQRVTVMRDGRIQQVGPPQHLYREPANLFVAAFIGSPSMNLVSASVEHDTVSFAGFSLPLALGRRPGRSGEVILGIRPTAFEDAAYADPGLPRVQVEVAVVEELGAETHAIFYVDAPRIEADDVASAHDDESAQLIADETRSLFTAVLDARTSVQPGRALTLAVNPGEFHFFDPETRLALTGAQQLATASV